MAVAKNPRYRGTAERIATGIGVVRDDRIAREVEATDAPRRLYLPHETPDGEDRREREVMALLDPDFELFEQKSRQTVTQPIATVRTNARLSLNTKALELLGSPAHIELLYSHKTQIVAIRGRHEPTRASFLLGKDAQGDRLSASITAFLRTYGLEKIVNRAYALREFPGGLWGFAPEFGREVLTSLRRYKGKDGKA